jgi:F-type H+-transporting ATPase subunit gamma
MAGTKEIRMKIRSVQNTRKITKAMEMVAASKMRKAQERMRHARPYGEKIRNVAAHISHANPEYRHPFLVDRDSVKRVGIIVVTTDKGLCGALNTNLLRMVLSEYKSWQAQGEEIDVCALGARGLGFMQRLGANIVSQAVQLGDQPHMDRLIGALKVMLDGYMSDRFDRLIIAYNRFFNTMKQEPVLEQLLPLSGERLGAPETVWDYIYEPEARAVLDQVMTRYIEALIYQAVAENMASEQSARMVAMKAASDNADTLIDELTLIYNKNRQAGITKEISEIVGGAAAV